MQSGYVLSVTQLNEYVAGLLQRDVLLRSLSVRGEVSGFKRHSSGHLYFSLKDGGALVRCVMFRQDAMACNILISDGMQLVVDGHAALYARDGQYQFYVKAARHEGEGELYRRFLMLKTRLEVKGYFEESHKKDIPALPKCIGVVTSQTGAVLHDIISVTQRRFPKMNILLCPVAVQGPGAAQEIADGIRLMNRIKQADVLIVGRGGGSMEDLWAFNEEVVAEAIYESEIPIISAVGHETDFSIADFVSDLRAPTPSAAAELCVPVYDDLLYSLENAHDMLLQAAKAGLAVRRRQLEAFTESGAFASPRYMLANARHRVQGIVGKMDAAVREALSGATQKHAALSGQLSALSPDRTLARGFALVRKGSGMYCGTAEGLSPGENVKLIFHDGTVEATVNSVEREEKRNG